MIVIGAMRCGTTALHHYLDNHPEIHMSQPKELNFFIGAADAEPSWQRGNWARGIDWYRRNFSGTSSVAGESSPGYTSPDHSYAAERIAAAVPGALLVYLIRDPIERAVSQYRLHRRDGTERRGLAEALADPSSQYVSRGRYFDRLKPYLMHMPEENIYIVRHEDLRTRPRSVVRALCRALDIDPDTWPDPSDVAPEATEHCRHMGVDLQRHLTEQLIDDARRLEAFSGLDLSGWRL